MFDLTISDIEQAENIIKKWATKAIGLIDPEYRDAVPPRENYLQIYFHDCTPMDEIDVKNKGILPNKNDIDKILQFSSTFTENDKVLIHCHAGISRSSAIAISIFAQHGMEPFEAFYAAERIRPEMYPNGLILRYADELLFKNGDLVGYLDVWLANFHPDRSHALHNS